jgi:hypothetical protein
MALRARTRGFGVVDFNAEGAVFGAVAGNVEFL